MSKIETELHSLQQALLVGVSFTVPHRHTDFLIITLTNSAQSQQWVTFLGLL